MRAHQTLSPSGVTQTGVRPSGSGVDGSMACTSGRRLLVDVDADTRMA
jgi:hypothetical protein